MQFTLSPEQVDPLVEVLDGHRDGGEVQVTVQGDGSLVLGFSMATVEITTAGTVEED